MPIIQTSTYPGPPFYQFNGHLETIVAARRKVEGVVYTRERIETPDDDFLDLDWDRRGNDKLVVLTHGLEGNSKRPYILGCVKYFTARGWDALAWNCRSCSGEMNRQSRLYNHGEIGDIDLVVRHAIEKYGYKEVVIMGFSMGGNISLKYAAVHSGDGSLPKEVKKVIAFSSPLDMRTSTKCLDTTANWIYRHYFITQLAAKAERKAELYPHQIDIEKMRRIKKWDDHIRFFASDINGYRDEDDFFEHGSAGNYINRLKIPALIVQAKNDPMLTSECMPYELAQKHPLIFLETPAVGGHCSFMNRGDAGGSWAEVRGFEFANG